MIPLEESENISLFDLIIWFWAQDYYLSILLFSTILVFKKTGIWMYLLSENECIFTKILYRLWFTD